jgi:transcriptional regulator GlxA family with amidase domain
MNIGYRTGIHNPKLLAAIGYMEVYLENPLSLSSLAKSVNISLRQLERLFKSKLGTTPARYYLDLRLERARQLLKQTSMSVLQVAVSTGFTSASHFTQSYKKFFGHPPSQERK